MAQIDTTRTLPAVAEEPATRVGPIRVRFQAREWAPRIACLLLFGLGGILANTLPAVVLEDGSTVKLSEVADKLTRAGDGWVMTLTWLVSLIAAVSAVVFPQSERFVQAIAISLGAILAQVLPFFVSRNLEKVDADAAKLGSGLIGFTVCFVAGAVVPWLSLLWWNRMHPVLGRDWEKWIFVLPAVLWILLLSVFPLAYAIATSRYAFRSGRIARYVGWGNYKNLFDIKDPASTFGTALMWFAGLAAAVMVIGLGYRWIADRRVRERDLRDVASFIPIVAVPVTVVYLAGHILREPLDLQFRYTVIFVVGSVSIEMVFGFLLALLMNRELRGRAVLRTIFTLPIFATPVAIGYLGRTIFYEGGGPVNSLLSTLGITPPGWLSDPNWAKVTTIIGDVWQWTPFVFIIALAGLQSLPQDVIEASEVDGANPLQNLWHIVLPLMAPILWLILLLRTIDAFKVFDLVFAMTLGGPGRATEYYSMYNYRTAWRDLRYGDAAAQGFLLLFIVMLLVSLLWGRIRHVYEEEEGARS